MSSEYSKWLSTLPNMEGSTGRKSRFHNLQEALVLDLQVMQADLFGLQGGLSNIASQLRELEVWVLEQQSHSQRTES